MSIPGYSKIYALGHKLLTNLFEGEVVIQEKMDGSQFSFGLYDGVLKARSRGRQLDLDARGDKLFDMAVDTVKRLHEEGKLTDGWTYRGEAITRPKHNSLAYDRIPVGGVILYDVDKGILDYTYPGELQSIAIELGLECVPMLYHGKVNSVTEIKKLLDKVSCLGGAKIEGFVVKNYEQIDPMLEKTLMGKYVSEQFKEIHNREWKRDNPTKGDIVDQLIAKYTTRARWHKAVQHLKERGDYTQSPKDIGPLMKEVSQDVHEECADEIKEALWKFAWPKISRGLTKHLPLWYKEDYLLNLQFDENE